MNGAKISNHVNTHTHIHKKYLAKVGYIKVSEVDWLGPTTLSCPTILSKFA